jgi:hypothetical protein
MQMYNIKNKYNYETETRNDDLSGSDLSTG